MNALRLSGILLMCSALTAATFAALVVDEKGVDKLVGTWKLIKEGGRPATEKTVVQFTKDEGNKLTFVLVLKLGGKERKETSTETDKKLTLDHDGKEGEFEKTE